MYFRINELFAYISHNLIFMFIPDQRVMVAPIENNFTQVHSIMLHGQRIDREEFELMFPTDNTAECAAKAMYHEEVENEEFMNMLGETHVIMLGFGEPVMGESKLMSSVRMAAAHLR